MTKNLTQIALTNIASLALIGAAAAGIMNFEGGFFRGDLSRKELSRHYFLCPTPNLGTEISPYMKLAGIPNSYNNESLVREAMLHGNDIISLGQLKGMNIVYAPCRK